MGREFGRLSTSVRNRVQFSISPFEQRVFPLASILSPIPNTIRRVTRNILPVAIRKYITSSCSTMHSGYLHSSFIKHNNVTYYY